VSAAAAAVGGAAAFFTAAVRDGTVRTRGVPAYAAGHRLPCHGGGPADGIFAEWRWDGAQLTAVNDRYGMHPLFFAADAEAIWISPSLPELIRQGAPAGFDWDALSVFLRIGFFVGDDTPFAAVKALPPGARLHWRGGRVQLDGGPALRPPAELSRSAALDGYIELFRAAIRRRLSDGARLALPLSGGRDSRHILLELCAQGRRPLFCVTTRHYPPLNDEDARIAALVTAALDLPHVVLDPIDRFDAELRKNEATSFCADEHAWTMGLADFLRGRADVVFDGIGGDVLSAGLFLTAKREALRAAGRTADLAATLLSWPQEAGLAVVLRPEARRRAGRRRAAGRIAAEMQKHAEAANPIGSFYFWNRTRREIALVPYAVLPSVGDAFAPYLDHDLYDFLASLPVRLLLDGRLHTDAIRRAFPKFREVPFQDPQAPRPRPWMMRRDFLRRLAPYARGRAGALARNPASLVDWCSLAHRFFDVGTFVQPELLLYLLQLERLCRESPR
jgi:hypothetical protein